jgi:hypothetical protein
MNIEILACPVEHGRSWTAATTVPSGKEHTAKRSDDEALYRQRIRISVENQTKTGIGAYKTTVTMNNQEWQLNSIQNRQE